MLLISIQLNEMALEDEIDGNRYLFMRSILVGSADHIRDSITTELL